MFARSLVVLSIILYFQTRSGELADMFEAEQKQLETIYPDGVVTIKNMEPLLEVAFACNRRFWMLFANEKDIEAKAKLFVDEFGKNGPLFDFLWLICEPTAVMPCQGVRERPMPFLAPKQEAIFRTAVVRPAVIRALVTRFRNNERTLHRYYCGVLWFDGSYRNRPWGAVYAAYGLPFKAHGDGSLNGSNAMFYGAELMLATHMLSLDVQEDLTTVKGVLEVAERLGSYAHDQEQHFQIVRSAHRWRKVRESNVLSELMEPQAWSKLQTPFPKAPSISDKARIELVARVTMRPCWGVIPNADATKNGNARAEPVEHE